MLGYIGIGLSLVATGALGYLLGSISRNKKVARLLAVAREEAEQTKKGEASRSATADPGAPRGA